MSIRGVLLSCFFNDFYDSLKIYNFYTGLIRPPSLVSFRIDLGLQKSSSFDRSIIRRNSVIKMLSQLFHCLALIRQLHISCVIRGKKRGDEGFIVQTSCIWYSGRELDIVCPNVFAKKK